MAGERTERSVEGDFWRDGAVCVRNAFGPEMVALAAQAIDANVASLSPYAKRASADDDGAFVEDFCNWQRLEPMERFIRESGAAEVAADLTGADTIRLYHDHVLVKEPGTRQRTPWHQDLPYYNVDGRLNISMWFPVDPVSRESTLEFVAGSHLGPWYMPRSFLDGQAKWFPDGTLAELPDIDGDPDRHRVIGWELEPGDAVFFHMLTLHGSGGVSGGRRRRVLSVRFLGDDMVHAPRPWTTSPPFPGLEAELPAGASLEHPLFPLLRSPATQAAADRSVAGAPSLASVVGIDAMTVDVRLGGVADPGVPELLAAHLAHMRAITPPEFVFAADADALAAPSVSLFTAHDGGDLVGCGALARLDDDQGEIKSMHVRTAARGRGVAGAVLTQIEAHARALGLRTLWLETGVTEHFAAAQALYRAHGYTPCGPFGSYTDNGHSAFFTKDLVAAGPGR